MKTKKKTLPLWQQEKPYAVGKKTKLALTQTSYLPPENLMVRP
jgi:hypothetical protein